MNLATKAAMWPTPQTDSFRTRSGARKNEKGLDRMARDWPTPMASDGCKPSGGCEPCDGNRRSADLTHVAGMWSHHPQWSHHSLWPTPLARDWKGTNSPEHVKQKPPARNHIDQLANFAVYSRQALTISQAGESICDQRRSLNPLFVEALMGWPTGWTGFDFAATAWSPWLQRMRSEFLRLGSVMMADEAAQ
jgi:DNA (cytosine-5)-methyltransferase 1